MKEKNKTNDIIIRNILKLRLLSNDYAQATSNKIKGFILDTMYPYYDSLSDERITYISFKLCQSLDDPNENDLYLEILQDLLNSVYKEYEEVA